MILIIVAFIGMAMATFQLTRIRLYLGWVHKDDLGAILSENALFGFGWLALLAGLTIVRNFGFMSDEWRDRIFIAIMILIVLIVWTLVYRLHRWRNHILKKGNNKAGP